MESRAPKLIAFYLPQFHPIPENDGWWGEGFTDWVNVRNAAALYDGHVQPRQPHGDLGYYDPRNIEVLEKQARIAQDHGIYGFCFYHYWFGGKLLLEKPVETFIQTGRPDLPFCLCWANEPWTRAWDGRDRDVLMPQSYGGEHEWTEHFNYLLPAFKDPRAIRVDGRPVFLIYRIGSITRANEMIHTWRRLAEQAGLPGLHIVAMLSIFSDSSDFEGVGIDATCEFYPTYATRPRGLDYVWGAFRLGLHLRLLKRYTPFASRSIVRVSYDYLWRRILAAPKVFPTQYRGAFASWDNTPRKGRKGFIMKGVIPERYRYWLTRQLRRAVEDTSQDPLVFINAWNEWAEGAYLEPDQTFGYGFLDATREAMEAVTAQAASTTLAAPNQALGQADRPNVHPSRGLHSTWHPNPPAAQLVSDPGMTAGSAVRLERKEPS